MCVRSWCLVYTVSSLMFPAARLPNKAHHQSKKKCADQASIVLTSPHPGFPRRVPALLAPTRLALRASPSSGPRPRPSPPASSPLLSPSPAPASSPTPPSHTAFPPIPLPSPRRGPRPPSTTRPSSTSFNFKPPTCTTSPASSSVRHFSLRPREGGVVTVTSRYLITQRTNSNKRYILFIHDIY